MESFVVPFSNLTWTVLESEEGEEVDSMNTKERELQQPEKISDIACKTRPYGVIVHYILRERNGVKMSAGSGKMIGQSVREIVA